MPAPTLSRCRGLAQNRASHSAAVRKQAPVVKTIEFRDDGQDFLEWDLDRKGRVIGCRPFQAWVWVGGRVTNPDLKPGDRVALAMKRKAYLITHPVKSIRTREAGT